MNYVCQLISQGKYDLISDVYFVLWGTEPPSLSSTWIQLCFLSNASWVGSQFGRCMYLIVMPCFLFWMIVLLSLPHSLSELWLDLRFTVQARLPLAAVTKGERERERERRRERNRNAETEIPFSSPIPPLFSHTVNTDDPGCRWWLHSATAVGWRWRELQLSVYKPVVLPGQCCCQMGFEQRLLVICDSTVCRFSFQPNTTAGDFFSLYFTLYSASCLVCIVSN